MEPTKCTNCELFFDNDLDYCPYCNAQNVAKFQINQNIQYGQNDTYNPNNSYGQSDTYNQNNQYAQNDQYSQNNQYAQNDTYNQNNQYAQNDTYNQNNQMYQNNQMAQNSQNKPKSKKGLIIGLSISISVVLLIVLGVVGYFVYTDYIVPNKAYESAVALYDEGEYDKAIDAFSAIKDYKDSGTYIEKCEREQEKIRYSEAINLYEQEKYEEARKIFKELGDFENSADYLKRCDNIVLDNMYNRAVSLFNQSKYAEARDLLIEIGDFKEATAYLDKANKYIALKNAKVGDKIYWGKFEQDGNTANGAEDIAWIVADVKVDEVTGERMALIISADCLTSTNQYCDPNTYYYSDNNYVIWENSSIRGWLSNSFYQNSFNAFEKSFTEVTQLKQEGVSTQDNVFIFGKDAIELYGAVPGVTTAKYTVAAANANPNITNYNGENAQWWLRTTYLSQDHGEDIFYVDSQGSVVQTPMYPYYGQSQQYYGVRPAMWVNITK